MAPVDDGHGQGLHRVIREELETLASKVDPDELAYLAATSKVELPIRDRLAWQLQRRLGPCGLIVAREWRRADIAVLRELIPLAVVEAKALYAFDVHRSAQRTRYLSFISSDLAKAAVLAPQAEKFALVLVTHVAGAVHTHLRRHVVKYSSGIAGAVIRLGDAATVRSKAVEDLTAELGLLGEAFHVQLPTGRVFDLEVAVDAWLVSVRPNRVLLEALS